MNKISYKSIFGIALFCTIMLLIFSSCKKNVGTGSAPVITGVRNYIASPNDTLLPGLVANGQWVVITGQNLNNATQIEFDGVSASYNSALFASNSAVVQIPSILFSSIDTSKIYTITYSTTAGSTTFPFKLGPAAPTITSISNVFANPGDSVYLYGANLVLVQDFSYAGTSISSFKSSSDGTALGFIMPANAPTDQVLLTTKSGSVIFKIIATPTIISVSNENANPGDSVYIYGTYFKEIQSISFAGSQINSFITSNDGTSIGFVLPTLTKRGPVIVTTKFGAATTVYNVNDIATGALSNWEWGGVFNWQFWGGASLTSGSPDFPGNSSQYLVLKTNTLASGEGNTYSSYAILLNAAQWIPTGNLADSIQNWALKFEVSIPQPWNGGSIDILSGLGTYIARWEPWQISSTSTAPYSTKGWITVTIPFSSFRATSPTLGEGKGASMAKFSDLLGPTGNSTCTMYIHNYSASATSTGFYGAFDNLRVVKIK